MAPNDTGPPPDAEEGGGTEAEEAAWEMATAEALRAQGQLADAANWYRRAANHLMEAGDDERAITIAKLAAELAALDDAGRPSGRVSNVNVATAAAAVVHAPAPPAAPARVAAPVRAPAPAPRSATAAAVQARNQLPKAPAGRSVMPWERKKDGAAVPSLAPPAAVAAPAAAGAPVELPPWEREASRRPPVDAHAAPPPRVAGPVKPPAPPPAATRRLPVAKRPEPDEFADEATTVQESPLANPSDDEPTGTHQAIASPLAAMLDEAVSDLDAQPSTPLSTAPGSSARSAALRPSLIYTPARAAEAERIAQSLPVMPMFAELPGDRLGEIARQVGIAHVAVGEALCEAGGPEGPMFLLLEGAAYVGFAGREPGAVVVGAGDIVGEIAALYGGPRTANVIAQDAVEALAFSPSLVRALAREFESFRQAIEETACERMRASLPTLAPMLRRVADAQRAALFAQFELRAVPEGTLLLTEGEPVDGLYIVAGGEAELYGGDFGVRRTHHARVGEALGVTSLVTGEAAGVSARASRTMLIARLDRERFATAMKTHAEWADALADVSTPGRGVLC